jgi:hypothetical protein
MPADAVVNERQSSERNAEVAVTVASVPVVPKSSRAVHYFGTHDPRKPLQLPDVRGWQTELVSHSESFWHPFSQRFPRVLDPADALRQHSPAAQLLPLQPSYAAPSFATQTSTGRGRLLVSVKRPQVPDLQSDPAVHMHACPLAVP